MSKIVLNSVGSLIDATTAKDTINRNAVTIQAAFENILSRDGTTPNQMSADFDMNSNRILNLPAPETADEPLRYQDLSTFVGGGTVTNIPAGGNINDVLTKASNADYDIDWSSAASEVTAGTNIVVTGASPAVVSTLPNPNFATSVTTPVLVFNGTTISSKTGTGALVLGTSPNITTPTGIVKGDITLGNVDNTSDATKNAAAVTLTNKTIDTAGGNILKIGGTTLSAVTGTGSVVLANAPSLVAPTFSSPALGTPASGVMTNVTGLPIATGVANLGTGIATFLTTPTSANLASAVTNETGSGSLVFATSPALVTPTGIVKGDVGLGNVDNTSDTTKWAAVKTLTNTTYDTAGTGNSFSVNGLAATINTGTGAIARATSPTFVGAITSPAVIGGTGVGSSLLLESTSGSGSTDFINFVTGIQVEKLRITTSGDVLQGITSAPALGDTGNGVRYAIQGAGGLYGYIQLMSDQAGAIEFGRFTFGSPTYSGGEKRAAVLLTKSTSASTTIPTGQVIFFVNNGTALSQVMTLALGLSVGTASDPGVGMIYTNAATFMLRTKTSLSNGAAAAVGTLTNAPAAGNPTKWLPYDDNGTTRYIPAW